jgi:hypothetical protein
MVSICANRPVPDDGIVTRSDDGILPCWPVLLYHSPGQIDQAKLALDQAKLQQKAAGEAARLELQEDIADERNDVNRERIAAQMRMAAQRGTGA